MAKEKAAPPVQQNVDDFTAQLIRDLNKEMGSRVAYNLAEVSAPTIVKRWIDTGSIQLNYAIRNACGGGWPEGRIIEITGLPSCGKSHLGYHASAVTQAMGGLVILIDTENATPLDKLQVMGINVKNRFVYVDEHCTENVFKIIESTILKVKSVAAIKDVPILVIWDSVAASSPKAELDGDYDTNSVGLQARVISKGMRKIVGVLGQNNVTLLCLNQLRDAIGTMYGDTLTSPGGKAIPFHASVRVRLSSGQMLKDAFGNAIGIHVIATVKKNKVSIPFGKCEFDIIFGKGVVEHEYIFDTVRAFCEKNGPIVRNGVSINVSGKSGWKDLVVSDVKTGEVLVQKKFHKNEFGDLMKDEAYAAFLAEAIDETYVVKCGVDAVHGEGESPSTDEGEGE